MHHMMSVMHSFIVVQIEFIFVFQWIEYCWNGNVLLYFGVVCSYASQETFSLLLNLSLTVAAITSFRRSHEFKHMEVLFLLH